MKTLLVVDGNSILNRAFYGIKPLTSSSGLPTNAVYGFITMLTKQCEKYSPTHRAIAFDLRAPTFRHNMYAAYKATRKGMPDDLAVQLPYAKRAAEALGFTVVEREGYEADDVLGTLSALGERAGVQTLIMTGDRDSLQLIGENTAVLLAKTGDYVYYDESAFFDEYGVSPSQFVDVKALMGDTSDNIPGVPGIGLKGALALISQFGSLDKVYEGYKSAGLKPGVVAKLEAGKESAYISRTLARIRRDVPDVPSVEEVESAGADGEKLARLCTELEFTSLVAKFGVQGYAPAEESPMPENFCESDKEEDFVAALGKEHTAISFCEGELSAFDGETLVTVAPSEELLRAVADNAEHLTCYDCKDLYKKFAERGVRLRGMGYDVMLAAYVVDSQTGFDLEKLKAVYIKEDASYASLPSAVAIYKIRKAVDAKLEECGGTELFRIVEQPLADVLADMEDAGFLIDREGLRDYGRELEAAAEILTENIYAAAGEKFNINSPRQLGDVLFDKLGLPAGKKTKTGYSTSADVLEELAPFYPIVADVLEYRKLTKLISTYVVGLLKVADDSGRVHTLFKQTGTATGRLSSAEPNLQNIPIRTEAGRNLRKYFSAGEGRVLIDADYSQIELRLLAAISGDENMISAFLSGEDVHASTASAVFGVDVCDVTPELRKRAKAVNFGIVYGIGEYSLSRDLKISVKQAKEYIENYLNTYPLVKEYLRSVVEEGKERGYVTTLYGRRRYVPELKGKNAAVRKFGERVAMNSPLQGTAADIIKLAMIGVSRRLREEKLDAQMILQVHDELIVESSVDCAERAAEVLREEMENAARLAVPLTVDQAIGKRWIET